VPAKSCLSTGIAERMTEMLTMSGGGKEKNNKEKSNELRLLGKKESTLSTR